MKIKLVKLISVFVCLTVAFGAVIFTRTELHGSDPESPIILYHNDRSWSRSNLPAQINEKGVYYAPLTFFVQLKSVNVRINDTLQTFIITKGDYYLSFDIATNYAANQDKIRIPLSTYEYEGERYVPIEAVCFYLELGYETQLSPLTGDAAIRVTDGQEQYSFSTLLRRRHPGFLEEVNVDGSIYDYPTPNGSAPSAVITAPSPDASETTQVPIITTAPPKLTERIIYITIEDSPGEYTDDILAVLDEFNCNATFFVVGNQLSDNIPQLMSIISSGHTLALHTMNHKNGELACAEDILADIEAENELLSRITKQKSRIWSAPNGPETLSSLTERTREHLGEQGYIVWDSNITVSTSSRSARSAAASAIDGIWNNRVCSLRFTEGEKTAEALRLVLEFIRENEDVCELRAVSPSFG